MRYLQLCCTHQGTIRHWPIDEVLGVQKHRPNTTTRSIPTTHATRIITHTATPDAETVCRTVIGPLGIALAAIVRAPRAENLPSAVRAHGVVSIADTTLIHTSHATPCTSAVDVTIIRRGTIALPTLVQCTLRAHGAIGKGVPQRIHRARLGNPETNRFRPSVYKQRLRSL